MPQLTISILTGSSSIEIKILKCNSGTGVVGYTSLNAMGGLQPRSHSDSYKVGKKKFDFTAESQLFRQEVSG